MASPFQVFKSKVALAFLGACLIGGTSAALAARTALPPQTGAPQTANVVVNTNATATPTLLAQATATFLPSTATPTDSPTVPAQPTATPNGQTSLRGTVQPFNPSGNTFTIQNRSGTYNIVMDSNTTFSGIYTTRSNFQTGSQGGFEADVHGKFQPDGTLLATSVYTYNNDN